MVEFLNTFLPIMLYLLGIVLLVVLIVLGIRFMQTLDRVNRIIDDVEEKAHSLDSFFHIIDRITDNLALVSDRVIDAVSSLLGKIFRRRKKEADFDE